MARGREEEEKKEEGRGRRPPDLWHCDGRFDRWQSAPPLLRWIDKPNTTFRGTVHAFVKQSIDDVGVTRLAETGRMLTEAGPKSRRGQEERNAPDEEEAQSPTKPVRVEVCLGPDCQGGATLLESKSPRLCVCASFSALNTHNRNPTVEELVSSRTTMASKPRTRRDITVGSTGCRDFCTVGPNVYVRSASEDEHFTRVDGPQACRRVVSSILADDTSGRDEALSSTQALLKRREDGIRWRRHKERVCREKRLRVLKRKVK